MKFKIGEYYRTVSSNNLIPFEIIIITDKNKRSDYYYYNLIKSEVSISNTRSRVFHGGSIYAHSLNKLTRLELAMLGVKI